MDSLLNSHLGNLTLPDVFSEKMSVNSPIVRYIGVSSYKGGHFFTLIINVLRLCSFNYITPGEWPILKSFVKTGVLCKRGC